MASANELRLNLLCESHTALHLAISLLSLVTDLSDGYISDVSSQANKVWQLRSMASACATEINMLIPAARAVLAAEQEKATALAEGDAAMDEDPFKDE